MDRKTIRQEFKQEFQWWCYPFASFVATLMLLPKLNWMGDWAGDFIAKHGVKNGS